jgi:hypothetical protein
MLRQQRLGGRLEESAERGGEVEPDRLLVEDRYAHLAPRGRLGSCIPGVLEHLDRERDIEGRHRFPVLPDRVGAEAERVPGSGLVDIPGLGDVRDDVTVRPETNEPAEDQRHELTVGGATRRQRADRARSADDALTVDGDGRDARRRARRRD